MSHVFVSYSKRDRGIARALIRELEVRGLRLWWDEKIPPGDRYRREIERRLELARAVVVLWSGHAAASNWVPDEAQRAIDAEVPVVFVRLDGEPMALGFGELQAVDLPGRPSRWPAETIERIAARLGRPAGPDEHVASERGRRARPRRATRRRRLLYALAASVLGLAVAGGVYLHFEPSARHEQSMREGGAAAPDAATPAGDGAATVDVDTDAEDEPSGDASMGPAAMESESSSAGTSERGGGKGAEKPEGEVALEPVEEGPYGPEEATAGAAGQRLLDWSPGTPGEVRRNRVDGLTYVWIPPGRFEAGCSPGDDLCEDDELPRREVEITRGFWLGMHEVTVGAYLEDGDTVGGLPPAPSFNAGWADPDQPMVNVSWSEAAAHCRRAASRLPGEDEWEYAARAGEVRGLPAVLEERAWLATNSGQRARAVAQRQPNGFGLHDMLGNAAEWAGRNPAQAAVRGGSWRHEARYLRYSFRLPEQPAARSPLIGFRCLIESSAGA